MYFIGQPHIMTQLADILPYLYETDVGMNMLFRGPSGWGKTRMSFMVCNYLSGGSFEYCLGDNLVFSDRYRVHFIDEVHLLEHPETIYPKMDSERFIIVLATNDVALLPEALSNRCVDFIFDRYAQPDLRRIAKLYLSVEVPVEFLDYIIESGGGNPRVIKSLVGRLKIILVRKPGLLDNLNLEEFKLLLADTFGIVDGMDVMCNRYLECLDSLGGTAALATIAAYVHIDQNTLKYYVEPVLMYKNKLRISSKGRSLIC